MENATGLRRVNLTLCLRLYLCQIVSLVWKHVGVPDLNVHLFCLQQPFWHLKWEKKHYLTLIQLVMDIWAMACDFQQRGILTNVDSDKPVQPQVKLKTPNDVQSVA